MYIKSDKETIREVGFIIPFHFIHLHGPVKLVYKIKRTMDSRKTSENDVE